MAGVRGRGRIPIHFTASPESLLKDAYKTKTQPENVANASEYAGNSSYKNVPETVKAVVPAPSLGSLRGGVRKTPTEFTSAEYLLKDASNYNETMPMSRNGAQTPPNQVVAGTNCLSQAGQGQKMAPAPKLSLLRGGVRRNPTKFTSAEYLLQDSTSYFSKTPLARAMSNGSPTGVYNRDNIEPKTGQKVAESDSEGLSILTSSLETSDEATHQSLNLEPTFSDATPRDHLLKALDGMREMRQKVWTAQEKAKTWQAKFMDQQIQSETLEKRIKLLKERNAASRLQCENMERQVEEQKQFTEETSLGDNEASEQEQAWPEVDVAAGEGLSESVDDLASSLQCSKTPRKLWRDRYLEDHHDDDQRPVIGESSDDSAVQERAPKRQRSESRLNCDKDDGDTSIAPEDKPRSPDLHHKVPTSSPDRVPQENSAKQTADKAVTKNQTRTSPGEDDGDSSSSSDEEGMPKSSCVTCGDSSVGSVQSGEHSATDVYSSNLSQRSFMYGTLNGDQMPLHITMLGQPPNPAVVSSFNTSLISAAPPSQHPISALLPPDKRPNIMGGQYGLDDKVVLLLTRIMLPLNSRGMGLKGLDSIPDTSNAMLLPKTFEEVLLIMDVLFPQEGEGFHERLYKKAALQKRWGMRTRKALRKYRIDHPTEDSVKWHKHGMAWV
eukprot:CAMPEP_0198291978 /NCGR_PEP_ID=MMETSP1449-20131203/9292_1 /TAXON_ID=420275 /ORGANISM="Attheya septentrionalis, Strain CCMP2084" /LENGTH=665 /DNA_ID=CAMNT_0043990665 /DNA_START=190 /DNA_END=2184 /DNA_ORIENTATION=+